MKKYNVLIFILLIANNLLANDDTHKLINDSTNFSKFNIHAGAGTMNWVRIGVNYRLSKSFSVNADYGMGSNILIVAYNADVNYHFKKFSGPIISPSITVWKWGWVERPEYAYIPSLNVGYIFYNPANSINSIQFRGGLGVYYSKDLVEHENDTHISVKYNFDIILGFQF